LTYAEGACREINSLRLIVGPRRQRDLSSFEMKGAPPHDFARNRPSWDRGTAPHHCVNAGF